jgi:hypothetical protein
MSSADNLAILHIELIDIEPVIWRRIAVRGSTSLATLHKIIQAAMGWLDDHLWEFTVDDVTYGIPDPDDASWGHKVERASTTKLAKMLDGGIKTFGYVYDMGDNWQHRIIVERVEVAEPGKLYPEFLGQRDGLCPGSFSRTGQSGHFRVVTQCCESVVRPGYFGHSCADSSSAAL